VGSAGRWGEALTFWGRFGRLTTRRAWDLALVAAFLPSAAWSFFAVLIYPIGLGSHANIYTDAAAAWLAGHDPWTVGPPAAIFAGPPPMLLPFIPFVPLPVDVTRIVWFLMDFAAAIWVLRRLGMPAYWIAFPPLFTAIILGHVEVMVLLAIVIGGAFSGLAAVVKPYAALPLLAERRWTALAVAVAVVGVSAFVLPWRQFLQEFPAISANLARQDVGDSVFGQPLMMVIAALALLSLGVRQALWLCVPLLWPHAQSIYKTMTIPVLCPVVAIFWALPIPGATLIGVVALAVLMHVQRIRRLPHWLQVGIEPVARKRPGDAPIRPMPRPEAVPI
jgi:hypothetical protein